MAHDSQNSLDLVLASLAGNQAAFNKLYGLHFGRVKTYFLRTGFTHADADDLSQEVFVNVARSLRTFDPARGQFRTWLGAIARNVARKSFARDPQLDTFDPVLAARTLSANGYPGHTPQVREQVARLSQCMKTLPAELGHLIHLRYVDAYSTRGIAEITGTPEATVRQRLQLARSMLHKCMSTKKTEGNIEKDIRT